MIYLICPTCKKWLGDKQEQYDKITAQICKDVESGKFTLEEADEMRKKNINSLDLKRYCCKTRVITYTKLVNIVK